MSDKSVDKEIEENHRRKEAQSEEDNDGAFGLVEEAISPLTDAIGREDEDREDIRRRTAENDSDQR